MGADMVDHRSVDHTMRINMPTSYRKLNGLIDHWSNHGVPQMLGTVISAVSILLGLTMWVSPSIYRDTKVFDVVFSYASPYAWGTVYIVTSIAVLIGVFSNQQFAQAPSFILGATFAMQGLLALPQAVNGEIPQPVILCLGFSWVCIITQIVCGARKVPIEKAPGYHQP